MGVHQSFGFEIQCTSNLLNNIPTNLKMAKRSKEMSQEYFLSSFREALKVPFPVMNIVPDNLARKLQTHCEYSGTSMQMLLASLLPATACALGTGTRVRTRNFGEDRCSVTSLYSIAGADPGSGKSVAYRIGLHKPMEYIEQEEDRELLIKDFTKQGIMKQQDEEKGKGIIGSDEVYGVLNQCLIRSDAGTASTGERQLLCSFWSGDGHSAKYATKQTIKIAGSALCIGGFTQPDKLQQLVYAMGTSNDGLLDRILLWACPKRVYYSAQERAAFETLQEEGGIDFCNVLYPTCMTTQKPSTASLMTGLKL